MCVDVICVMEQTIYTVIKCPQVLKSAENQTQRDNHLTGMPHPQNNSDPGLHVATGTRNHLCTQINNTMCPDKYTS